MEELIKHIITGLIGALIGSGVTIPIIIRMQSKKQVMKQKAGDHSSQVQAGGNVNGNR